MIVQMSGAQLKTPCMIKSNMGHAESASGICAMIKACMVFQKGLIPPNLHLKTPNPKIEGLMNKKIVPVTKIIPFKDEIISLNCFGFGGANVHVILRGHNVQSSADEFNLTLSKLPRLVNIPGRSVEGIKHVQNYLESSVNKLTRSFLDLLNEYSKTRKMPHRGFTLIEGEPGKYSMKHFIGNQLDSVEHKKVYLTSSTNLINVDPNLKDLPVFSDTINRLESYLKPFKSNLFDLVFGEMEVSNPLESIVKSIAIQLAIVNVFKSIQLNIDGVAISTIGSLINLYANNKMTEQEVILTAYWFGHFVQIKDQSIINPTIEVLSSCEQIKPHLSEGIKLTKKTSGKSCIISGHYEEMFNTIVDLQMANITVKCPEESLENDKFSDLNASLLMRPIKYQEKINMNHLKSYLIRNILRPNEYIRVILELTEPTSILIVNADDRQFFYPKSITYEKSSETVDKLSDIINTVIWNIEESPAPSDVSKNDLVIYKMANQSIDSLISNIEKIQSILKPNGHLLILTRENSSKLESLRSNLFVQNLLKDFLPNSIDSNSLIEKMNENNWVCISQRTLSPTSLPLVGLMFKKLPESINLEKHKIIRVNPFEYSWLDNLKGEIKADEESIIWLISQNVSVLGLVKCLSLEPFGSRIRCVALQPGSKGIDSSSIDLHSATFHQLITNDCKFNIYDDKLGWGDYCHFEIPTKPETDSKCLVQSKDAYVQCLIPGDLSSLVWTQFNPIPDPKKGQSLVTINYSSLNFKDIMHTTGRLPSNLNPDWRIPVEMSTPIGLEYAGVDSNGNRLIGIVPHRALATKLIIGSNDFCWSVPSTWTMEDAATVPVVYATAIYSLLIRGQLRQGESVLIHAGTGGVGIAAINICLSMNCKIFTTVGTDEKRNFLQEQLSSLDETSFAHSRSTSFEEHILRHTNGRGVDVILNSLSEDKLQASVRCLAPGGRFLEIGKNDINQNNKINVGLFDECQTFHGIILDSFIGSASCPISKEGGTKHIKKKISAYMNQGIATGIVKPIARKVFEMNQVEKAFRFMATGKQIGKVLVKINNGNGDDESSLTTETLTKINETSSITESLGANVIISTHDLTKEQDCCSLFESLSPYPIGGIFNCALVLSDALISDQNAETYEKVCSSKVKITKNLDKLTRSMAPVDCDYFVCFSSVASGRGNKGQSNYGLANSYMESICQERFKHGLHGLAIQWGYVGDVGFVVEKIGVSIVSVRGTAAQRIHSCFSVLERALTYPVPVVSSSVKPIDTKSYSTGSGDIVSSICHILGFKDINSLDLNVTLGELGMDSLMAIEVQQVLEKQYNILMNSKEIRSLTIIKLKELSNKIKNDKQTSESLTNASTINESSDTNSMIGSLLSLQVPKSKISNLNDLEKSNSFEPIYYVPPIEENYDLMKGLIDRIKRPALGLNWPYDLSLLTSIDSSANYYADYLTKCHSPNDKIHMVGYSFGGIIAYNIACELETRFLSNGSGPIIEKLILIDADPEKLKKVAEITKNTRVKTKDMNILETEFVKGAIQRVFSNLDPNQFDLEIRNYSNRKERFEKFTKIMIDKGIPEDKADMISKVNELTFQKGQMLINYSPKLKSKLTEIVHIRAKTDLPLFQSSKQTDFKLGTEHFFDGNHHTVIGSNLDAIEKITNNFFDIQEDDNNNDLTNIQQSINN
ncbi:LOW QUALITY PROTEIN: fatty acid synthase-like [Panonychus citri]|uniref:LOW QUALITY PROTEIN: fatty acid synthase-like n=1 Tax=Panonychus citri TaxID=50023 RepID=UPI002307A3F0|nr:LOW QUALITY PROTEIN: fatty acid synthase-like [Panonychus citri]